tara:strand:- start:3190 stop:3900 length:711 start_codon:yes stop_codon:yes gene_type:complete
MTDDFNITIPKTLRDLNVAQWQKYLTIYEKNKDADNTDFLEKKMLEIFCGVSLNNIDELGLNVFDDAISHVAGLLNSNVDLVPKFDLKGTDGSVVHFGMIPNLDKMSYGEFLDLDKYMFDEENFHKALAVIYRPIKHYNKDKYLIHDYQGTELLSEVMKDTPLDVALGVRVFFWRLATKLGNYTMVSTLKELQKTQGGREDKHSLKSGETIKQYLLSLEKMLAELEKLQSTPFTNV